MGYVTDHTVAKMKTMCSNISNSDHACVATKVCGLMAKHPDVALGMIIEKVRPMSLAMAYCVGKSDCNMPDQMTMTEIATGSEPHEALLDNFDKMDFAEVEEQTMEVAQDEDHGGEELGHAPQCPEHKHAQVGPKCMKKTMRRVMGFAITKARANCANAQNSQLPVMQKMCQWMAEHKMAATAIMDLQCGTAGKRQSH